MALYDQEYSLLKRAQENGEGVPLARRATTAPVVNTGNANSANQMLDATGAYQLPSIDGAIGARRRFSAVPAEAQRTPGYITDKSLHAPQDPVKVEPVRPGVRQAALEGNAGFTVANVAAPDDRERQSLRSELDSQIFRMGNPRMRSQREMLTALIGQRGQLTRDAFAAGNERAIAQARIGAEAAQANASLAEAGARRRTDADQFNIAAGERRSMFDTERQDAKDAAKAAAPFKQLEYMKGLQELKAGDAKAIRDQAEFDATFPGVANKADMDQVKQFMEAGLTYEQAQSRVLDEKIANGENPRGSRTSSTAYDAELSGLEEKLNEDGVGQWWKQAAGGDGYAPFNRRRIEPGTLKDTTQVDVEKLSPFNPVRVFTSDNNRIKTRDANGNEVVNYVDDETAARLKRRNGLLTNGGR